MITQIPIWNNVYSFLDYNFSNNLKLIWGCINKTGEYSILIHQVTPPISITNGVLMGKIISDSYQVESNAEVYYYSELKNGIFYVGGHGNNKSSYIFVGY